MPRSSAAVWHQGPRWTHQWGVCVWQVDCSLSVTPKWMHASNLCCVCRCCRVLEDRLRRSPKWHYTCRESITLRWLHTWLCYSWTNFCRMWNNSWRALDWSRALIINSVQLLWTRVQPAICYNIFLLRLKYLFLFVFIYLYLFNENIFILVVKSLFHHSVFTGFLEIYR